MSPRLRPLISEDKLTEALIERWAYLKRPDTLVASIPNKRAFGQAGLMKGLPDLLCIGGNIGIGLIELKTEAGRLSDDQKEVRKIIERNGVPYAVTYGLDEAIRALEAWGLMAKSSVWA